MSKKTKKSPFRVTEEEANTWLALVRYAENYDCTAVENAINTLCTGQPKDVRSINMATNPLVEFFRLSLKLGFENYSEGNIYNYEGYTCIATYILGKIYHCLPESSMVSEKEGNPLSQLLFSAVDYHNFPVVAMLLPAMPQQLIEKRDYFKKSAFDYANELGETYIAALISGVSKLNAMAATKGMHYSFNSYEIIALNTANQNHIASLTKIIGYNPIIQDSHYQQPMPEAELFQAAYYQPVCETTWDAAWNNIWTEIESTYGLIPVNTAS